MWPFLAGIALVAIFGMTLRAAVGTGPISDALSIMLNLLPVALEFSVAFIAVIVVQQDNLLGDRQDWLLRPIRSGDVMLAKLVFVIVAIHGPLLLVDILEVKLTGISFAQSLVPALSHQLVLFCCFTAPALIVGAVTRTALTALSFVVVLIIAFAALFTLGLAARVIPNWYVTSTSYSWVVQSATLLLYVIAITAVLHFQFRARREIAGRVLFVAATVAAVALLYGFPFRVAFAVQQRVDVAQGSEGRIALAPASALFKSGISAETNGSGRPVGGDVVGDRYFVSASSASFHSDQELSSLSDNATGIHKATLPILVDGLPANDLLVTDTAAVRIAAPDGTTLFSSDGPVCAHGRSGNYCLSPTFMARQRPVAADTTRTQLSLPLPTELYRRIENRTVSVTIDFTLTLLRPDGTASLHAVQDKKFVEGIGSCATRIDSEGDDVELVCLSAVRQPACLVVSLQDPHARLQNPPHIACRRDYAPFPLYVRDRGAVHRTGGELPFFDPNGLAHYPVGTSEIGQAQFVINNFVPQAHFKRRLVMPTMRLIDREHSS